jgi:hypothetical protein
MEIKGPPFTVLETDRMALKVTLENKALRSSENREFTSMNKS